NAFQFWPEPHACRVWMVVAVCCFWIMMRLEKRPAPDYGLVIGPQWWWTVFGGLAAGAGACAGLYLLAWAVGAFTLWPAPSVSVWLSGCLTGLTMLGAGFCHEMVFRGYWQCLFRQRYGTAGAIIPAACSSALVPPLTT